MNTTDNEKGGKNAAAATRAASFISGLLRGWGVPANLAKAAAGAAIGAAIGALMAAGLLSSCTTMPSTQQIRQAELLLQTIHPMPKAR